MLSPLAACKELVARLKAAGFSAALDPAELDASGSVWVQPRGIRSLTLDGGGELLVWLYLIAPNTDYVHSWTLLDDGLAGLLDLDLPLDGASEEAVDMTAAMLLPDTSTPAPAYRLALTLDLEDT